MVRLIGVNIPDNKRVAISLTHIYGIGIHTGEQICSALNIPREARVRDLKEEELSSIRDWVANNLIVEGDLYRQTSNNIKALMNIGCYRGLRHRKGKPARGQRTRSNASTCVKKIHLRRKDGNSK